MAYCNGLSRLSRAAPGFVVLGVAPANGCELLKLNISG
jgi:hypothetical protein